MGIIEIALWLIIGLFILAFAIRFVISVWGFIYDMAPIVIPLLLLFLFMLANNIPITDTFETEVTNANHIESIEDTG